MRFWRRVFGIERSRLRSTLTQAECREKLGAIVDGPAKLFGDKPAVGFVGPSFIIFKLRDEFTGWGWWWRPILWVGFRMQADGLVLTCRSFPPIRAVVLATLSTAVSLFLAFVACVALLMATDPPLLMYLAPFGVVIGFLRFAFNRIVIDGDEHRDMVRLVKHLTGAEPYFPDRRDNGLFG